MQKKEFRLLPHTYTKTNSKWITGLKVKAETIKFLKENTGLNLCDPQLIKEEIAKLDFVKFKNFHVLMDIIRKLQRQHHKLKKIISNHITNK